jgi:sulfoxide reductase heme-binding subunit YedZ
VRLPDRVIRFGLKPAVLLAGLGPAIGLAWGAYTGNLTADPLAELTNQTGIWTLRFLCVTLALTPLRRLTGWNAVIRFRRMAGLFAFFYGSVHLMVYVVFDRLASLGVEIPGGIAAWATLSGLATSVGEDIYKRPFITIGFTTWLCMLPLAITSTAGWIRRLGGRRWNALHRLVYAAGVCGVTHYWWGVKADVRRPETYALIVGVLLAARVVGARRRAAVPRPAAVRPASATRL